VKSGIFDLIVRGATGYTGRLTAEYPGTSYRGQWPILHSQRRFWSRYCAASESGNYNHSADGERLTPNTRRRECAVGLAFESTR
jgi:hypothetical protein